ncbi:MAG: hypothetical protein MJ252_18580 [archaeon]|nr:hypothetical protein [archaeon]
MFGQSNQTEDEDINIQTTNIFSLESVKTNIENNFKDLINADEETFSKYFKKKNFEKKVLKPIFLGKFPFIYNMFKKDFNTENEGLNTLSQIFSNILNQIEAKKNPNEENKNYSKFHLLFLIWISIVNESVNEEQLTKDLNSIKEEENFFKNYVFEIPQLYKIKQEFKGILSKILKGKLIEDYEQKVKPKEEETTKKKKHSEIKLESPFEFPKTGQKKVKKVENIPKTENIPKPRFRGGINHGYFMDRNGQPLTNDAFAKVAKTDQQKKHHKDKNKNKKEKSLLDTFLENFKSKPKVVKDKSDEKNLIDLSLVLNDENDVNQTNLPNRRISKSLPKENKDLRKEGGNKYNYGLLNQKKKDRKSGVSLNKTFSKEDDKSTVSASKEKEKDDGGEILAYETKRIFNFSSQKKENPSASVCRRNIIALFNQGKLNQK